MSSRSGFFPIPVTLSSESKTNQIPWRYFSKWFFFRIQATNHFTLFIWFISLSTSSVFLNLVRKEPRRDRRTAHTGTWLSGRKGRGDLSSPQSPASSSALVPLLSSQGVWTAQAVLAWAWKIPFSLPRGVWLRRGWEFLKGTIHRKLTVKQKTKRKRMNHRHGWTAGSVTEVWSHVGLWGRASREPGWASLPTSVLCLLPIISPPRTAQFTAASSLQRGWGEGAITAGQNSWSKFLIDTTPAALGCQRERVSYQVSTGFSLTLSSVWVRRDEDRCRTTGSGSGAGPAWAPSSQLTRHERLQRQAWLCNPVSEARHCVGTLRNYQQGAGEWLLPGETRSASHSNHYTGCTILSPKNSHAQDSYDHSVKILSGLGFLLCVPESQGTKGTSGAIARDGVQIWWEHPLPSLESGGGDLFWVVLFRGITHETGLKHLAANEKFEKNGVS